MVEKQINLKRLFLWMVYNKSNQDFQLKSKNHNKKI